MALDEPTRMFVAGIAAAGGPPLHEQAVGDVRGLVRTLHQQLGGPATEVGRVSDVSIPVPGGDIGARVYWPPNAETRQLPIVLHYHGGGWAAGDLESHDSIARFYCAHADAIVVHVDYRRPPEFKFPKAVDDSYAALVWAADHAGEIGGDARRIAVVGDSAGGNLSAAMTLLARARGGPAIAFQALVYPALDLDMYASYPSRAEFGGGNFFLTTDDMAWFTALYLRSEEDAANPLASPIREADVTGLPPALIVTAGCDILRDEGAAYADRLRAAGVPVEYRCFETTIHAFMAFAAAIPLAAEGLNFVAERIKTALAAGALTA